MASDSFDPKNDQERTDECRNMVSRIVYLCALASEAEVVASYASALRRIKFQWRRGVTVDDESRHALMRLEAEITAYILTRDPLREFTQDSLRRKLGDHKAVALARRNRAVLLRIIIAAFLATGCVLFALTPLSTETRRLLAVPTFLAVLIAGAIWFFLSALRDFKAGLRVTFTYFFLGIVFFGFSIAQIGLIQYFHLDKKPFFEFGGTPGIGTVPILFMYLGLRKYASLLKLKTWFKSLKLSLTIWAIVALLFLLSPYSHQASNLAMYFNIKLLSDFGGGAFAFMSVGLAYRVFRSLTAGFARSARFLWIYAITIASGLAAADITLIIMGQLHTAALAWVIGVIGLTPVTALLMAGYSFKRAAE